MGTIKMRGTMWSRVREKLSSKTSSKLSSKFGSRTNITEVNQVVQVKSTPDPLFAIQEYNMQKSKATKTSSRDITSSKDLVDDLRIFLAGHGYTAMKADWGRDSHGGAAISCARFRKVISKHLDKNISEGQAMEVLKLLGCGNPAEIQFNDIYGHFKSTKSIKGLPHWLKLRYSVTKKEKLWTLGTAIKSLKADWGILKDAMEDEFVAGIVPKDDFRRFLSNKFNINFESDDDFHLLWTRFAEDQDTCRTHDIIRTLTRMGGGKKCEPVPNPLGAFQADGETDKLDQLIQVIKKARVSPNMTRKAFKQLDEGNRGRVRVSDFRVALRNLGVSYPADDFNDLVSELDPMSTGFMSYELIVRQRLQLIIAEHNLY